MIKLDDLRLISVPIIPSKRATAGVSGTVDMADLHEVVIVHTHGLDSNSSKILIGHCSASTTLYASATAFSPAVATALATSGAQAFVIRAGPNVKRFLRIKLSTTAASSNNGVLAFGLRNRTTPYSATLGAFATVTTMTA